MGTIYTITEPETHCLNTTSDKNKQIIHDQIHLKSLTHNTNTILGSNPDSVGLSATAVQSVGGVGENETGLN